MRWVTKIADAGRQHANEIWTSEELDAAEQADTNDHRPEPEFAFSYKQAVDTSDTFLGMDPMGKDPTTTSCEELVLTVNLPEVASADSIDLDLKPERVTVQTASRCAHSSSSAFVQSAAAIERP